MRGYAAVSWTFVSQGKSHFYRFHPQNYGKDRNPRIKDGEIVHLRRKLIIVFNMEARLLVSELDLHGLVVGADLWGLRNRNPNFR